jgi:hypothetical protein
MVRPRSSGRSWIVATRSETVDPGIYFYIGRMPLDPALITNWTELAAAFLGLAAALAPLFAFLKNPSLVENLC